MKEVSKPKNGNRYPAPDVPGLKGTKNETAGMPKQDFPKSRLERHAIGKFPFSKEERSWDFEFNQILQH